MIQMVVTRAMRPPKTRIGKLGQTPLPRTVPLLTTVASIGGAVLGLLLGLAVSAAIPGVDGMTGAVGGAIMCAALAGMAVEWKPWQGESVARVVFASLSARQARTKSTCPGTGMPTVVDHGLGRAVCSECAVAIEDRDGLAVRHEWVREVYWGMARIADGESGPVRWISGSVPAYEHSLR